MEPDVADAAALARFGQDQVDAARLIADLDARFVALSSHPSALVHMPSA